MTGEACARRLAVGTGLLGLDVGEARIGLARGEVGSPFVFGRGALERTRQADDVSAIRALMEAERASLLVVGLPTRSDGGRSAQTQRVLAFARALEEAGLELALEDERYTTRLAAQRLGGLSKRKRRDKGRLDEAAAVLILESFLKRIAEEEGA